MTKQVDASGWYADVFKRWDAKLLGRKPTTGELETIHRLGARPGKQALASAMALREAGVTGGQIVIAAGAPQLNKMRGFMTDGLAKRVPMPPQGTHTVYKLILTSKGTNKVEAAAKATAETPAKPKAPRKPKAKPAAVPPVPATGPVQEAIRQEIKKLGDMQEALLT